MGLGRLFIYVFIFIMGYFGSHKLRQRTMHIHILQLLLQHRIPDLTQSRRRTGVTAAVTVGGNRALMLNKTLVYPKDHAIILNSPRLQLNNAISSITPFISVTSAVTSNISPHKAMHYNGCLHYRDVTWGARV